MAAAPAPRYGPEMKASTMSRWLYSLAAVTAAAALSLLVWIWFSGGVVRWWVVVSLIATLGVCTVKLLHRDKPNI